MLRDTLLMKQQTIGMILETASDTPLSKLPLVTRALRLTSIVPFDENTLASEHFEILKNNEPDILDLTVNEILKPKQKGTGHQCMTIILSIMLVIMSLGYAAMNMYTSYMTKQFIAWEDMLLPLMGPLLIVLYDRGLLSKENRGMVQALLGQTPLTMMEAVSHRIANGPTRQSETYVETTQLPDGSTMTVEKTETTRSSNGPIDY